MDDVAFAQLMGALCGANEADLWDAVAADVASGVLDVATLCDPVPVWTEGERAAASEDLLTGSVWWETAEAEERQGVWWDGPQEDREDDTADEHDEWVRDWTGTTTEDDK